MNIAYIGNFTGATFSTENDIKWTLTSMGHMVFPIQEDRDSTADVLNTARERNCKLVLWTRTHGFNLRGDAWAMTAELRKMGIKTAAFHLDKFWGLDKDDGRESRIKDHPFFFLDKVFTPDGGNDDRWKAAGINHYWMLPGVVSRDCYFGQSSLEFGNQIAFAGATTYHAEYPFRTLLVQRLREIYGTNFRTYSGVREDRLNSLYATARVVVGDHCFSGTAERYCSDRLPETIGRGGFIIYPETKGITDALPGLVTYRPGDIEDLKKKIDYFLDDDHQNERIVRRNFAHEFVKANWTYTNRMQVLLKEMGF